MNLMGMFSSNDTAVPPPFTQPSRTKRSKRKHVATSDTNEKPRKTPQNSTPEDSVISANNPLFPNPILHESAIKQGNRKSLEALNKSKQGITSIYLQTPWPKFSPLLESVDHLIKSVDKRSKLPICGVAEFTIQNVQLPPLPELSFPAERTDVNTVSFSSSTNSLDKLALTGSEIEERGSRERYMVIFSILFT